jgi:hypothetical protein
MNKLLVIGYLPPTRIYPTDAFMKNMKDFPPRNEMVLFSDEYEAEGVVKLAGSVEVAKVPSNRMAVNNLIFFIALRIAASKGASHILLVENDCRVNKAGWDEIIFQEFLNKNPNAICGGSLAIFNPCSFNQKAAQKYENLIVSSAKNRPVPFSVTGSSNLAEFRDSCVFPNGALAIYRMDWLLKTFPQVTGSPQDYIKTAQEIVTWDYEIGKRLWNEFKENTYDKVVHIDCHYSGYGNVMTTDDERRQLLESGRIVAVHQIKSDWTPEPFKQEERVVEASKDSQPPSLVKEEYPKTTIFIVTYAKDFPYLRHCLRSIKKFATGFSGVTILVPTKDVKELRALIAEVEIGGVKVKSGYEWAKKGFCWHMAQITRADEWCPEAEYIAHFDPDCIFTKPVTPNIFFLCGASTWMPILRYEPFESLARRNPGVWNWKIACDNALPFQCNDEGMRGHPEVYHRGLYAETRKLVEQKTGQPFNDYVKSTKNDYPQTYAEFPTLSAVALEKFRHLYAEQDCSKQEKPERSPWPVIQFWSHGPIDQEQTIWIDGEKQKVIPLEVITRIIHD